MTELFFSFCADVTVARQEDLLRRIRCWPDVQQVARFADDPSSDLFLICTAYLADNADAAAVVQRLMQLPEIEQAEAATPRKLL